MNQDPNVSGHDQRIAQADARTDQANTRTQQADARTDQANTRTDEANVRTKEANTRTDEANTRTEHAEHSEQALRASELSYRRLFEAARDGILILDVATGRITDANPFLIELLGFSHGEMVGKTVGELSPFKDILSNQTMLDRLQKDGYIRYEDLPLETRDGRHIAVEFVSNVYQAGNVKVIQCNIRDITEHKLAEEALRASEARYHTLFDCAPDGIVIADPESHYLDGNPGICRMLGYTREELIGKHASDIVVPSELKHIEEALDIIKTTSDYHREWQFRRKDGSVFSAEVIATMMPDGNLLALIRDITERKQAEESLRLLESAVKQSKESIVITDAGLDFPGPEIIFVNPAFTQMTGYTAAEVIGKSPRILQGPRTDKAVLSRLRKNLEQGEPFAGEAINYRKDGTEFDLEWQIAPLRNADGKTTHFVATQHDITERKQAENLVRQSQERYRSLIDNARDAIFTIATDGTFTSLNPAVEIISGVSRADWIGKPFAPMVHPGDLPLAMEMFSRILKGGQSPVHELRGHPSLKRSAIMEMTLTAQKDETGKIIGVLGIGRDITERKMLEQQFRQSQKMESIGTLAGGVAHDFNNILAVIQMQAELLKSSGGLSAEQTEFADEIGATVQRAAALTRQLLLFSRKETMQLRDLDLNQSINSLTNMLRRVLGEDIEIQFKFSLQPLLIHADAGMMDQVLLNLAVNSRDAMPKGGRLIIETSAVDFDENVSTQSAQARPGSFVCLSVSDNGCGIPPENLSRIFEPFFTTKEVGKGTGLGLATLFGIVQQHKGWVNVYSEVGQGTTFRIYLPRLVKLSPSPQKPEQPALTAVRGGGETILFVEDDNFLRPSIFKTLTRLGYRVLEASNGVEALAVWKQHRDEIHLLLTDLVMPGGINGKELGEQLLSENPKLKVIYASGYSAEIISKDFPLEEGVNFLTKPFQAQKLAQTIRHRLDQD